MLACDEGNLEIAQLLLNANARVNIVNNDGNTALFYACQSGIVAIVQLLLDKRARIPNDVFIKTFLDAHPEIIIINSADPKIAAGGSSKSRKNRR